MDYKEFFEFLDGCKKKGSLPNGTKLTRREVIKYFAKKKTAFISVNGKRQTGTGCLTRWYAWWYDGVLPKKPVNMMRNVPAEKAVDISLQDIELDLEDGISNYLEPYELKGELKIGIISDIHIPYHDLPALKLAINHLRKERVNVVILNGDIFDFYKVSKYQQIPSKPSLLAEIEMGKRLLEQIRQFFPSEKILFKVGNHEQRLNDYIIRQAPALYGIEAITLPELIELKKYNIEYIESYRFIRAGDLMILHGHELKAGGINVARSVRLKTGGSVLIGHNHKTQMEAFNVIGGKREYSYVTGCLCDLSPEYCIVNQMNHGFAIVNLHTDSSFEVENYRIEKGMVLR